MKPSNKHPISRLKNPFVIWLIFCSLALLVISQWTHWGRVKSRNTNRAVVKQLGFVGYACYETMTTIRSWYDEQRLGLVDGKEYLSFLQDVAQARNLKSPAPSTGKNVIYLQLESVDAISVNATYKGKPVMPFLKGLAKRSVNFRNNIDNTGSGRTTDGEFLVLCSLPPVSTKPVYNNYDLSKIPSMPRVMEEAGYRTFSMHGNEGNFWNRANAHRQLGYQETYYEDQLDATDKIGWGVSDESLLQQAALKIKASNDPVFAHLILLTHHHPYNHVGAKFGYEKFDLLKDEIDSLRYVDQSIKRFFETLENYELLDECIIAIYSDHDSATEPLLRKTYQLESPPIVADSVPLIIHGLDQAPTTIDKITTLQDLPVIVLHELGIEIPYSFSGNTIQSNEPSLSLHGSLISNPNGDLRTTEAPISVSQLTKLAILHPEKLQSNPE